MPIVGPGGGLLESVYLNTALHPGRGHDDPDELKTMGDEESPVGNRSSAGLAEAYLLGPQHIAVLGIEGA